MIKIKHTSKKFIGILDLSVEIECERRARLLKNGVKMEKNGFKSDVLFVVLKI